MTVKQPPVSTWRLRQSTQTTHGQVAYDVIGSGPPVILVHGTPSWSVLWRDIAPGLAADHTVYLWDLLGYGDSRIDADTSPSIALHAQTLAELVERWELDAPALVGHDIGGGAVLRAHLLERLPASRLALMDATILNWSATPVTLHMQRHLDVYRSMPEHVLHAVIATHLQTATHTPMPAEVRDAYLDRFAGARGQQRYLDHVAGFDDRDTQAFEPYLAEITVPTRILWGAEDAWLDPALGRRLADVIPGADFVPIPGGGHFVQEDQPAAVLDALHAFLNQPS
jgi:pimeloyl-ACP methyl ester carboxylesterase